MINLRKLIISCEKKYSFTIEAAVLQILQGLIRLPQLIRDHICV